MFVYDPRQLFHITCQVMIATFIIEANENGDCLYNKLLRIVIVERNDELLMSDAHVGFTRGAILRFFN